MMTQPKSKISSLHRIRIMFLLWTIRYSSSSSLSLRLNYFIYLNSIIQYNLEQLQGLTLRIHSTIRPNSDNK